MLNYYEILGLHTTATTQEIKNAYRKLAKIYHPDKNPDNKNAEERFKLVKDAYEVLIDPVKKRKHDASLEYQQKINLQTHSAKKNRKKNDSNISVEELKRRQYFEQHYSKFSQKKQKVTDEKKKYNETRAIIFSIPIALALLFFIVNIYNRAGNKQFKKETTTKVSTDSNFKIVTPSIHNNGDEPYIDYIGKPIIDKTSLDVVRVINNSGNDAIVFITDTFDKVIRHYYIKNNIELFFEFLPIGNYKLKLHLGYGFNCKLNNQLPIFCNGAQFFVSTEKLIKIDKTKTDSIKCFIDSKSIISKYKQVDSLAFFKFDDDLIHYLSHN